MLLMSLLILGFNRIVVDGNLGTVLAFMAVNAVDHEFSQRVFPIPGNESIFVPELRWQFSCC